MTQEKLQNEVETLKLFFELYCHEKQHADISKKEFTCQYNTNRCTATMQLCPECQKLILYAVNRLSACPHEQKPKCRKCKAPCYEKEIWKTFAKVMRYSGTRLGILKIKKALFDILST